MYPPVLSGASIRCSRSPAFAAIRLYFTQRRRHMADFLELLQKKIACLICFSGLTIILIWEPDGPEWLSMIGKRDLTGLFTI